MRPTDGQFKQVCCEVGALLEVSLSCAKQSPLVKDETVEFTPKSVYWHWWFARTLGLLDTEILTSVLVSL